MNTAEEGSEESAAPTQESLAVMIAGPGDSSNPVIPALSHSLILSTSLEGARLLDFRAGDLFLVKSPAGGGAFFDEWLIPLASGGTAYVAMAESGGAASAPVTHLRLTEPEWANHAAAWLCGETAFSETIRSVAIEAGAPLLNSAIVWNRRFLNRIKQTIFFKIGRAHV